MRTLGVFSIILIFFMPSIQAMNLPVTSQFGWRNHPISGEWKFHSGVDLGYEYGSYIGALFDGQIFMAGDYDDGYGYQVLIYHSGIDAYTRYAHCSQIYVSIGDFVTANDIIAQVGSTGYSTGPHLHLEYIVNVNGIYEYSDPLELWK